MQPGANELVLIRHAPSDHAGRLAGRSDVGAILPGDAQAERLRALLGGCRIIVSSPARRCRLTADWLFPHRPVLEDQRLWEQDFGAHEGMPFADIPDIGALEGRELAAYRPPGGESFDDMARRAGPAILDHAMRAIELGPVAVVAHAGTVRAAIGMALGEPSLGLRFEVAPLSLTRLGCLQEGFVIGATNWMAG
ncbi:histidine phosphatase family protein [Paracoccus sp. MBLB3053]|uniref:Histidine phosphatase family protein n=1 Tax=Paracoccus aurantius TaxID=3073814 RepID=A0ABU2HT62_9RHOB|nr:histidine phosphatase family protein [Paracoccus sp. MBLB3053]MDS9468231.1 histidine phosphatase family protein [Paracoccus sp. MBLB3053]